MSIHLYEYMKLVCRECEQGLSVLYKAPFWQLDSQFSLEERDRLVSSEHLSYTPVDCHELARDWGWKRVDGKTWKEDVVILWFCVRFAAFLTLRIQKSAWRLQRHYCQACDGISSKHWKSSVIGRSASASHHGWQKRLARPTHFQDMGKIRFKWGFP